MGAARIVKEITERMRALPVDSLPRYHPCVYDCGGNDNDPDDHMDGCPKKGIRLP